MTSVLDYAPIAAAAFAVPQFLPQLLKLRATHDAAGISWSWAALTTVNNAAWIAYFALSRYWTALIPACSVTLLAGALTIMLTARGKAQPRSLPWLGAWAVALAAVCGIAGRAGLGTLLTAAFIVQVAPSLWTAYHTARPNGISAGTWTLILGELLCFLTYGRHQSDPRLIALGATGVTASAFMLARIFWTRRLSDQTLSTPAQRESSDTRSGGRPRLRASLAVRSGAGHRPVRFPTRSHHHAEFDPL
jgi:uncharacterized protein with PQ loop repeat